MRSQNHDPVDPGEDPAHPSPEDQEHSELLAGGGETLMTHSHGPEDEQSDPGLDTHLDPEGETLVQNESTSILTQLKTRLGSAAGIRLDDGEEIALEGPASDRRYETVGEIARGGMGAIVKIVDRDIRRPVAMKVILGDEESGRLERFVEEAQVTGQLEHPNIVPVHELGLDPGGRVYFTMKLVKGASLEEIIDHIADGSDDAHSLNDLLLIFLKVCDAVAFAHSRGVIHRDLKPENVMVGRFGEVLVLDWGLAKVRGAPDRSQDELVATVRSEREVGRTLTGDVMGTPSYMPPEQADGLVDEIDERSDIFALGGILYRILTHEAPYTGASVTNVMRKAVEGDLIPARRRSPHLKIPAELESICRKAMAKHKGLRYPDVQALIHDLRAFLDRRLVSAHRYSPLARFTRFVQRHPAAVMGTAVSLFLLVAGGAASWILAARAEAESARADAARAQAQASESRARAEALQRAEAEKETKRVQTALDKGRAVAKVMAAAEAEFEPLMLQLKKARYGSSSAEERRAILVSREKEIAAFESDLADDSATKAAWLALKGWLTHLSGDTETGRDLFEASRKTDPAVAYGALFEAMVHLADYLDAIEFPRPSFNETMTPRYASEIPETEQMKASRQAFRDALAPLQADMVWGEGDSVAVVELLDGFWGASRLNAARIDQGVTKALRITELRWVRTELLLARMTARYMHWNRWGQAYEDVERALLDLPGSARLHTLAGLILTTEGGNYEFQDWTPDQTYAKAIEHFEKALEIDPNLPVAPAFLGAAHRQRGIYHYHFHRYPGPKFHDPRPHFDRALAASARGLDRLEGMDRVYARLNRALTYQMRAKFEVFQGRDPIPDYEKALAEISAVLDADPGEVNALYSRGDLRRRMAASGNVSPQRAEKLYRDAIEDLSHCLREGGYDRMVAYFLGRTYQRLAELLYGQGKSPAAQYQSMVKISENMLEFDPEDVKSRLTRIRGLHGLAQVSDRDRDGKAADWSAQAEAAAQQLIDKYDDCWEAHEEMGQILAFQGNLAARAGKDPEPLFARAARAFTGQLAHNKTSVFALNMRGQLRRILGGLAARKKKEFAEMYQGAVADFEAASAIEPWRADWREQIASAFEAWSDAVLQSGDDPRPILEKAVAACDAWAEAKPDDTGVFLRRGLLRARLSEMQAAFAGDDDDIAEAAIADLKQALPKSTDPVRILVALADRLFWLGRLKEARAAFGQAKAHAGNRAAELDKKIAQIDALIGQPAWATLLWRAEDAVRHGAWTRADRLFRKGRDAADKADAKNVRGGPPFLARSLFSHACVMSNLSQGRHGQREVSPLPEKDRTRLRKEALAALDQAVSLGMADLKPIETHPWLASMRKLPEYPEYLKKWKAGK